MSAELRMLEAALIDVLERYAFMFAEPTAPEELPVPEGPLYRADMSFTGPRSGSLCLVWPTSACVPLAANILGAEPQDLMIGAGEDAFRELLNVTCGEFLVKLGGPEAVFNLSIPTIRELPPYDWQSFAAEPGFAGLLSDDIPLLFQLNLQDAT